MVLLVIMDGMSTKTTDFIRLQVDHNKTHAKITIFGVIGRNWCDDIDNSANRVMKELNAMQGIKSIDLKLSTMGGTFLDGLPIYNLLSEHPATINVDIMGYCLSMGTHIMMAASKKGGKIRAYQNSLIMMHNAQGVGVGSQHDLRKAAEVLSKHEKAVIPRYRERMGLSESEVQALLDAETWFSADEALAAGLIDEIIDPVDLDSIDKEQPKNNWKYAAENFKNPPDLFLQRIENAAQEQPGWVKSLIQKVGFITPLKNPPSEEDSVEQKDIDAIAEKIVANMKAAHKEETSSEAPVGMTAEEQTVMKSDLDTVTFELDNLKTNHAAVTAERDALKTEKQALEAKVAELSKPAGGQDAPPPSAGPAGESPEHFS